LNLMEEVHVDEKWFFDDQIDEKFYLLPDPRRRHSLLILQVQEAHREGDVWCGCCTALSKSLNWGVVGWKGSFASFHKNRSCTKKLMQSPVRHSHHQKHLRRPQCLLPLDLRLCDPRDRSIVA
jgi:hypothetical protein